MNKLMKKEHGFTLIEAMITVAIAAIIASFAIPSYVEQVKKGKRSDAKIELLRLAQIQESYFAQNLSYAKDLTSTRANGGLGFTAPVRSENEEYTISMTAKDRLGGGCNGKPTDACTSYTLTATPTTGKSQVNDSKCLSFTLTNTGLKGVSGSSTAQKCWK